MVDQLLPSIRQVESVNSDYSTNVPYAFRPGPNLIKFRIEAQPCSASSERRTASSDRFETTCQVRMPPRPNWI